MDARSFCQAQGATSSKIAPAAPGRSHMMASMSDRAPHPLDQILAEIILEEGGTCSAMDVRTEVAACLDEIRQEQAARGEEEGVICHFYVNDGVAIFTIVGDSLDLYVIRCPKKGQWELVNRFERLARSDGEGYRRVLAAKYGKDKPDLLIEPTLAIEWLYGGELPALEPAEPSGGRDRGHRGVRIR